MLVSKVWPYNLGRAQMYALNEGMMYCLWYPSYLRSFRVYDVSTFYTH